MDNEILEQNLKCPICLNLSEEPWESSCCGNLFCGKCIKNIKNQNCPICRSSKVVYRENTFAKNLLSNISALCPYGCEGIITLDNIQIHRYECLCAKFKCTIDKKCKFEGMRKEAMKHLIDAHADELAVLSENFGNLKGIFDKYTVFEKISTMRRKKEKEMEKEFKMEFSEEYSDIAKIRLPNEKINHSIIPKTKITESSSNISK